MCPHRIAQTAPPAALQSSSGGQRDSSFRDNYPFFHRFNGFARKGPAFFNGSCLSVTLPRSRRSWVRSCSLTRSAGGATGGLEHGAWCDGGSSFCNGCAVFSCT
jgi:hypothetical protein